MTAVAAAAALAAVIALLACAPLLVAAVRRRRFYRELGPVVRIATPCRIVSGRALVPGAVGLTQERLVWRGLAGVSGAVSFPEIARIESDARLSSGRRLLRSEAFRITAVRGESVELVLSKGAAWEWHRALGEWIGKERLS
jgi:hypothetical protein